jgi:hypothetical protein
MFFVSSPSLFIIFEFANYDIRFYCGIIIIIMALGSVGRGRPYYVALINMDNDRKLELMGEFDRVCSQFHYQEVMQLSRALGLNPNTIYCWKYKVTFPHWDIALAVIDWVKQGKPKEKTYQQGDKVTMLP